MPENWIEMSSNSNRLIWFATPLTPVWNPPDVPFNNYHGWLLNKVWWTHSWYDNKEVWYGMEVSHNCSLTSEVSRKFEPFEHWECLSCGEMAPLRVKNFITNYSKLAVTL